MSRDVRIEEFEKIAGPIGGSYDEDTWMARFGIFCLGWDNGEKHCQFSPTGDNHHNAALCPHCGEPLREAIELLKRVKNGDSDEEEISKFLEGFSR